MKKILVTGADDYGRTVILSHIWAVIQTVPRLRDVALVDDNRVAIGRPAVQPAVSISGTGSNNFVDKPTPAFAAAGRGYGNWLIQVTGGVVSVTAEGAAAVTVTPTSYANSRRRIGLPSSNCFAVLPETDGTWRVKVWAKPAYDYLLMRNADPAVVFRPGRDETEDTIYDVWLNGQTCWEKAAAAAIGLSRRIDDVRLSRG
jgi:hypothetical protein